MNEFVLKFYTIPGDFEIQIQGKSERGSIQIDSRSKHHHLVGLAINVKHTKHSEVLSFQPPG